MFKVHKFRRIVKIPHIYTTYPIFQKNVENSAHSKNTITHRIYILLYVQSTHLKKKKNNQNSTLSMYTIFQKMLEFLHIQ